jgi:hypothetical protein
MLELFHCMVEQELDQQHLLLRQPHLHVGQDSTNEEDAEILG